MGDGVAVRHGVTEVVHAEEVADVGVDLAGRMVRRRAQIEDPRLVAGGAQLVDDMGADESGPPGDEHPHREATSLSGL